MSNLSSLARSIDRVNQVIGETISWLSLLMVVVQFLVVVLRYVFGYGSIFMQESIIYMHGMLFMFGAGYALLHDGHVRVDIFYRDASPRTKAKVDLFGSLFLLIPVCSATFYYSLPYVQQSWSVLESSKETSGIPAVFLLKSVILVFCVLMIAQGISMAIHSLMVIFGKEQPHPKEQHEGI